VFHNEFPRDLENYHVWSLLQVIGCSISESPDHLSNSAEFIFVMISRPAVGFDALVILKLDRLWIFDNCSWFSLLEM